MYENDKANSRDSNNSIRMVGTNIKENSRGGKENPIENSNFNLEKLLNENNRINSAEYKFLRSFLQNKMKKTEYLKEIMEIFENVKETATSLVGEDIYNEKIEDMSAILKNFKEDRALLQVLLIDIYYRTANSKTLTISTPCLTQSTLQ
jgi:hypothetical protein